MRHLVLIILLFTTSLTSAQILNAESLRKVTDTSGFSGTTTLKFALKRTTNDFLTFGSTIHLQYKMNKNLYLFKNDISFQKIEGEKLDNSGISHIRYNHRFHPRIAWEVFAQGQYNKVSLVDFRALLGTGPRFKLTESENYKFYLGTLVMYEHEELVDGFTPVQRDFRGSTYLSFSLYPTETISLTSTTYYQPKLSQFSDFRISSQSALLITVYKKFAFAINYTFTYDAFPAIGIPNSQYDFTTGIAYSFD